MTPLSANAKSHFDNEVSSRPKRSGGPAVLSSTNHSQLKAPPSDLSSRPERSVVEGSAVHPPPNPPHLKKINRAFPSTSTPATDFKSANPLNLRPFRRETIALAVVSLTFSTISN